MNDQDGNEPLSPEGVQPTTDVARPTGGGVRSGGAAGGDKVDPINSGPTAGHTIAGRDVKPTLVGGQERSQSAAEVPQSGGAGQTESQGHGGPETQAATGSGGREPGEEGARSKTEATRDVQSGGGNVESSGS